MALIRCLKHGIGGDGGNTGSKHVYAARVQPEPSFPNLALLCGNKNCFNTGWAWLTSDEFAKYQKGERVFSPNTASLKLKISNSFVKL